MNALHIESERRLQRTVADILTSHERPVRILVTQNAGCEYWIVGEKLTHWLRKYQKQIVVDQGVTCDQRHYTIVGCPDFAMATIACEVPR